MVTTLVSGGLPDNTKRKKWAGTRPGRWALATWTTKGGTFRVAARRSRAPWRLIGCGRAAPCRPGCGSTWLRTRAPRSVVTRRAPCCAASGVARRRTSLQWAQLPTITKRWLGLDWTMALQQDVLKLLVNSVKSSFAPCNIIPWAQIHFWKSKLSRFLLNFFTELN